MITSIIMLTYNKLGYTKKCIESIRKNTKRNIYELIVIDNGSNDGTKEWLKKQNDIIVLYNDKNVGFPKGCNQGIELAKGDNILLLNNDTVVTKKWLDNLTKCLYSSEKIGAVGPVSNSCPYYQSIDTKYSSIVEMNKFALKYNASDSSKWEERLKLIGFCMLIKREVIEKIGLLDERFSPGNYEDDDYSIRIVNAGYELMLCKDTFIHHYGGVSFSGNPEYSKLLKKNETKFREKWGFTSGKNMEINRNLISLIDEKADAEFNVFQIGCGCGATLLYLKSKFKNANLYGMDINKNALTIVDYFAETLNEDIYNVDKICNYFKTIKFDYVLINHILKDEICNNKVLVEIKKLIRNKGKILIEMKENKGLSKKQLVEQLVQANYKNVNGTVIKNEHSIKEYIFKANVELSRVEDKMKDNIQYENPKFQKKLKFLLRRIENNIEVEESREKVFNLIKGKEVTIENILFCVVRDMIKKDEVLNSIAVKFYEKGLYDNVIPLFQAALEYNPNNTDVIYNLAYFLYEIGEKKLSLTYFEKIKGINPEIDEFIKNLRGEV